MPNLGTAVAIGSLAGFAQRPMNTDRFQFQSEAKQSMEPPVKTNWKQIIDEAPEQDISAILRRLARQAVAVHLSEQTKRGGAFVDAQPYTNRLKSISPNMEVNL